MKVQFQKLGQSLVLVLDPKLLADHGVDPLAEYSLELTPERISLVRPHHPAVSSHWAFEDAQRWVSAEYAPAFRVLAR